MKEYVLNNKTIFATEKAYNLIYKEQGYLPVNSDAISEVTEETVQVVANDIIDESNETDKTVKQVVEDIVDESIEDETIGTTEEVVEKTKNAKTTKKARKENE